MQLVIYQTVGTNGMPANARQPGHSAVASMLPSPPLPLSRPSSSSRGGFSHQGFFAGVPDQFPTSRATIPGALVFFYIADSIGSLSDRTLR